jgi:hypothetical protein
LDARLNGPSGVEQRSEDAVFLIRTSMMRTMDLLKAREAIAVAVLVLGALFVLYALFLDQGGLLAPFLGIDALTANYVHEFAHDARHLLALPCH